MKDLKKMTEAQIERQVRELTKEVCEQKKVIDDLIIQGAPMNNTVGF